MPNETPAPLVLDQVAVTGAVILGLPLTRLVAYVGDDDQRIVLDLPRLDSGSKVADDPRWEDLRPTQRRMMRALRDSTVAITRKALAMKIGRKSTTGKFSLYLTDLDSRKLIFEQNGTITDDPKKFEEND